MSISDDDNPDEWQHWWLSPGFPPTPGPTPPPKGTPGHRTSTGFLCPQPGPFVVHRLLTNASASTWQTQRLKEALREAITARMLMPAAERASELRAELAHHRRQLDAAVLHVHSDAPTYDERVDEAFTDLEQLVADCSNVLALAPTRDEEKDRNAWVMRLDRADQVRIASHAPASDRGQVIDAAARFTGGASPREMASVTSTTARPHAAAVSVARKRYRLDQISFTALVSELDELDTTHISAAVAAADYEDAAVRALARVHLGLDLPIEHVVPIVAGLTHLDVVLALLRDATGDVVGGLIGLLDDSRIPPTLDGSDRRAIALLALWQLGAKLTGRETICRWVRRTLRTERTNIATDVLRWLAMELRDPDVVRVATLYGVAPAPPAPVVNEALRILTTETLADSIRYLPGRALDEPLPSGGVRAAPKVRPNEPCPCGSGKKYKRCHGDGTAVPRAAPAHREHQLGAIAGKLTPAQLGKLSQADLAQVDPTALGDPALVQYLRLQIGHHDWRRARATLQIIDARSTLAAQATELHEELLMALFRNDQFGRAAAHMASVPASLAPGEPGALVTALADGSADALKLLRQAARDALADASGANTAALAHILLAYDRPLGILVARAAMRADQPDQSQLLADRIEEARDDLLLAPRDPSLDARSYLARLEVECVEHRSERERVEGMLEAARGELGVRAARIGELEREVARRSAETRNAAGVTDSPHAHAGVRRRELRERIQELEALVREKNEQLAALRRTAASPQPIAAPTSEPAAPPTNDDDVATNGERPPRDVLVIRYSPRAANALSTVPYHVAAQTARLVGVLSAGDVAAWRGAKQAKDMPRPVLMARIGIHHRLLYRVEDGTLEVIDLVTREELLTTLKRMRER